MRKSTTWLLAALLAVTGIGFAHGQQDEREHAHEVELPKHGIALLRPTQGNNVRGILRLTQDGENLSIRGRVVNLTPGKHGFHIHEYGDPRSPDGTSAGGHFDPHGKQHGPPGKESHVGDLGNIAANEEGIANIDITVENTPLHFILGRSFVVHAEEDDLESQPSGDAGGRVAVGLIGVANPEIQDRRGGRAGQRERGERPSQRERGERPGRRERGERPAQPRQPQPNG